MLRCIQVTTQVFLRDPVPEDFLRFSTYTSRVKTFFWESDMPSLPCFLISPDVWTTLLNIGPKPLLPNARIVHHQEAEYVNLEERDYTRGPFYPAELLLGPRLEEVHIDYGGWPSDQQRPTELTRAICRFAPRVTNLHVFAEVRGISTRISEYRKTAFLSCPDIGKLQDLVEFDAYSVNVMPAALTALGALPRLQEMLLRVQSTAYDWDMLPHSRRGCFFPALTKLKLYETAGEWCTAFIHAVTSTSIWKLELDYLHEGGVMDPTLVEALCTSIGTHSSAGTLEVLILRTGGVLQREEQPVVYQSQQVAPLLSLPALRHLSVDGNCQTIADDAFLDAMTRAWPNLESLHFRWPHQSQPALREPGDENYPKATLFGLLLFARHLQALGSLELAIDMREVPNLGQAFPPVSLRGSGASTLEEFWVSGSVLGPNLDLPALVSFFSAVFPSLRYFRHSDMILYGLMEMHKHFVAIRRQERKWALENVSVFEREDSNPGAETEEL